MTCFFGLLAALCAGFIELSGLPKSCKAFKGARWTDDINQDPRYCNISHRIIFRLLGHTQDQ